MTSRNEDVFLLQEVELQLQGEGENSAKLYVVFQLGESWTRTVATSANGQGICSFSLSDELTLKPAPGAADLTAQVYEKRALRADRLLGEGVHHIRGATKPGKLQIPISESKGSGQIGTVALYLRGNAPTAVAAVTTGVSSSAPVTPTGTRQTAGTRDVESAAQGMQAVRLQQQNGPVTRASGEQPICNEAFFLKVEDRPVLRETITHLKEHRNFEKEFVQETRPTGRERELLDKRATEVVSSETRIVAEEAGTPCGGVPVGPGGAVAAAASPRATHPPGGSPRQNGAESMHGVAYPPVAVNQPICDQRFFTKVEDRPIVKETITIIREHRYFEKEFVQEVRPTGREQELQGGERNIEVVDSDTRVVNVAETSPCAGVPVPVSGGIAGGAQMAVHGVSGPAGPSGMQGVHRGYN